MASAQQETPVQRKSELLQRMRASTPSSVKVCTDNELKVFAYLLEDYARQSCKAVKREAAASTDSLNYDRILARAEVLSVLKKFPGMIGRNMRGNSGFFSSDENQFLPVDQAFDALVGLLSRTEAQITQDPHFLNKCKQHVAVLQTFASEPELFDDRGSLVETTAYLIAITATAALMVAFLYVTPVLAVGGAMLIGSLAMSLLVELAGLMYHIASASKAYNVIEYMTETMPMLFGLTPQDDVQQSEPKPAETISAQRDPNKEPQPSVQTGLSFLASLPHRSFSLPSIRVMVPSVT